jgi:hypothetical protein
MASLVAPMTLHLRLMRDARSSASLLEAFMAGRAGDIPGAAHLVVVQGRYAAARDQQVFEAMMRGWRQQQLSRNLAFSTVDGRERLLRAFQAATNAYPWQWLPQHLGSRQSVATNTQSGRFTRICLMVWQPPLSRSVSPGTPPATAATTKAIRYGGR